MASSLPPKKNLACGSFEGHFTFTHWVKLLKMIHGNRSSYTTDTCNDLSQSKYCVTAVIRIKRACEKCQQAAFFTCLAALAA
jgi:hypothetical protein